MVRIGMKFDWNGRRWEVTGFNAKQVLVQSGGVKTGIDHEVFLKIVPEAAEG